MSAFWYSFRPDVAFAHEPVHAPDAVPARPQDHVLLQVLQGVIGLAEKNLGLADDLDDTRIVRVERSRLLAGGQGIRVLLQAEEAPSHDDVGIDVVGRYGQLLLADLDGVRVPVGAVQLQRIRLVLGGKLRRRERAMRTERRQGAGFISAGLPTPVTEPGGLCCWFGWEPCWFCCALLPCCCGLC